MSEWLIDDSNFIVFAIIVTIIFTALFLFLSFLAIEKVFPEKKETYLDKALRMRQEETERRIEASILKEVMTIIYCKRRLRKINKLKKGE